MPANYSASPLWPSLPNTRKAVAVERPHFHHGRASHNLRVDMRHPCRLWQTCAQLSGMCSRWLELVFVGHSNLFDAGHEWHIHRTVPPSNTSILRENWNSTLYVQIRLPHGLGLPS
ncbi:hypothetical protein MCOR08_002628 [Pyricularia oryzae]|nr:hypothetical protein MCOR08_002628 [Pyricularia oryzae]